MPASEQTPRKIDHRVYDDMLTTGRRVIWNDKEWRQGPERAFDVSSQAIQAIGQYQTLQNKTYMEIGCGPYSPLGVSTVMYLNGVENCIAFDRCVSDYPRAAEALYDLLAACALEPSRWNMTNQVQTDYFKRLYSFDVVALKNGNLSKGIAKTSLNYIIGNLENVQIASETISLASSRATLEHIPDFRKGMQELYRIMKPGGVSSHSIDLVDHRIYRDPEKYNMWSFLQEGEGWSDGLCNRLRASEILETARSVGFKTEVLEIERHEIPPKTLSNFSPVYASMDIHDLEITSIVCTFCK